ncbi:MAG: Omp28-related outer membrane protein [Vicingaceae bacterium]
MRRFTLILSVLVLFFACDKIDDPFPPNTDVIDTGIVWDDSVYSVENDGERFVLLEEYTGHLCQACPGGAREISRLVSKYGEKFIPVSIHTIDVFAAPQPGAGGTPGAFSSDYRTTAGDEYSKAFTIDALPGGVISRLPVGSTPYKLIIGEWEDEAVKILGSPAVANLGIRNYFNAELNTYQVRIDVEWLEDYTGDMNLQVQLLEDSIVDWQKDGSDYIENYMHRHMFREALDGTWGETIPAASSGEISEFVFTREFDPTGIGYKLEHMIILAFIYKQSPVYEVMQVNEAHLIGH